MSDESLKAPPADDGPEPPPRGVRAMAVVRWLILVLSVLVAGASWYSYAAADGGGAATALYQCPMHPEIVSNRPGECPICHMDLEPIAADRRAPPAASSAPAATERRGKGKAASSAAPTTSAPPKAAAPGQYSCPMHPEVVSDGPGRCPICKMDLVRVEPHAEHEAHALPEGTSELGLALDRVQAIGVRTAKVREVASEGAIRAPAIVEAPEQTVARVHVRAAGFVEAIAVDQTGVRVQRGQRLLSIYSPEIYQAQSELLATRDWPTAGRPGASGSVAARRKLELLGVPATVADRVLADNQPMRTVHVVAPIAGYVTRKDVTLGSFVTPEQTLYEIVDLSKVYVVADLYSRDAAAVRVGTRGTFKLTRGTAPAVEATVDLVYPQLNAAARTTRVRMTLKNEALALTPGEYGIVEFASTAGSKAVVIPTDALVDTGTEQYVFVERAPGHYSPRRVQVAAEVEDGFEIRGGLEPGETVVSGATFLIDSESRLRASIARSAPVTSEKEPDPPLHEHRH